MYHRLNVVPVLLPPLKDRSEDIPLLLNYFSKKIAETNFKKHIAQNVYPGRGIISRKNRSMFEEWNRSDPVDEWECERARRIEKIQGNRNEIELDSC